MLAFLNFAVLAQYCLFFSNLWFYLRVLRPIRQLSLQAKQLTQGDFDCFKTDCGGIKEIVQLRHAMAGMVNHIKHTQKQSRAYAEKLANGQELERKRIAHELHDDTIQSTVAITHSIDLAKSWVKSDSERATETLQLARQQAVEVVTNLRNLIAGLRPPALEELGLIPALEMEVERIGNLTVDLKVKGVERRISESRELALFRSAQEALKNVCKHSQADRVNLTVEYFAEGITLQVEDDGIGFSPPSILGELALDNHYGLIGIQERISTLDGWIRVESEIHQGTTLTVYLSSEKVHQPSRQVLDPVCHAQIEPQEAYDSLIYDGETYYFCCPVCQGSFQKSPTLFLN